MPWKMVKVKGGYKVQKKTGKMMSKKPQTKEKAMAQMRALYANTKESL